jgi:hypothetical protein
MIQRLSPAKRQLVEHEVEALLDKLGSARDDPESLEHFARSLEQVNSGGGDRPKLWALFIRRRAFHVRTSEIAGAR